MARKLRKSVSISGLDLNDHFVARQVYLWAKMHENRAMCLNRDVVRMRRLTASNDVYVHLNRPCILVDLVGIVVGSQLRSREKDSSIEYLVDDGTEVISVFPTKIQRTAALAKIKEERAARSKSTLELPPSNPQSEGIPEEYRPRPDPQRLKEKKEREKVREKYAAERELTKELMEIQSGALLSVGAMVRVIGRVGNPYYAPDENEIHEASVEILDDSNEETLHVRKAVQLARTTYSHRFILPDLPFPTRRTRLAEDSVLRQALFGGDAEDAEDAEEAEEEEDQPNSGEGDSADRLEQDEKARRAAISKRKIRKALFGDDEDDEDEDEAEEDQEVSRRVEVKTIERHSSPKPRKKPKGKSSVLRKALFGSDDDEDGEADSSFQQKTPRASSNHIKFASSKENPTRISSHSSNLKSSASLRPSQVSSSLSLSSINIKEVSPSTKGFKTNRDDSGVGGVGADSSNFNREIGVEERASRASAKRQRSSSQVSDVQPSSKKSVKDWSKTRPSQQTVDTFRFYLRMHIKKYCRASQSNRSSKREASPSGRQESKKRTTSQSLDSDTPKASRELYKGKSRDISTSILCPSSDSEDESMMTDRSSFRRDESEQKHSRQPPAFTLAYLMRVKDLRNHARETVKVIHKKEREKSKSASSSSSSKSTHQELSDSELEQKVCRLFSDALREMVYDGSLVSAHHELESVWPFNGKRNLDLTMSDDEVEVPTKFERSILLQDSSSSSYQPASSQPTSSQQSYSPSSRSISSVESTPSKNRKSYRISISNQSDPYLESSSELKLNAKRRNDEDPFETPRKNRSQIFAQGKETSIDVNPIQLSIFKRKATFYQLVSPTLLKDPIVEILKSRKLQSVSIHSSTISSSSSYFGGISVSALTERLKWSDMRWEYLTEDKVKDCLEKMRDKRLVKVENRLWEWTRR